jgi:hypothetical protein
MGCGSLPCSSTILDTPPPSRLDHQAGIRVFQLGLASRLTSRNQPPAIGHVSLSAEEQRVMKRRGAENLVQ